MRLVILSTSFWESPKGAETGQDDESQGKKKDLGGSTWVLGHKDNKEGAEDRVEGST